MIFNEDQFEDGGQRKFPRSITSNSNNKQESLSPSTLNEHKIDHNSPKKSKEPKRKQNGAQDHSPSKEYRESHHRSSRHSGKENRENSGPLNLNGRPRDDFRSRTSGSPQNRPPGSLGTSYQGNQAQAADQRPPRGRYPIKAGDMNLNLNESYQSGFSEFLDSPLKAHKQKFRFKGLQLQPTRDIDQPVNKGKEELNQSKNTLYDRRKFSGVSSENQSRTTKTKKKKKKKANKNDKEHPNYVKKFKFSVLCCFCTSKKFPSKFIEAVFRTQRIHDAVMLIFWVIICITLLITSSLIAAAICSPLCLLHLLSTLASCRAASSASSKDPKSFRTGPYKLAVGLGSVSCSVSAITLSISALICFFLAMASVLFHDLNAAGQTVARRSFMSSVIALVGISLIFIGFVMVGLVVFSLNQLYLGYECESAQRELDRQAEIQMKMNTVYRAAYELDRRGSGLGSANGGLDVSSQFGLVHHQVFNDGF